MDSVDSGQWREMENGGKQTWKSLEERKRERIGNLPRRRLSGELVFHPPPLHMKNEFPEKRLRGRLESRGRKRGSFALSP